MFANHDDLIVHLLEIGRLSTTESGDVLSHSKRLRPTVVGSPNRVGYLRFAIRSFYYKNSMTYLYNHRVVCIAAHGPPPGPDWHVNHIDEVKSHNSYTNLEWLTPAGNYAHSSVKINAAKLRGENHPKAKLSEVDVIAIRGLRGALSNVAISKKYRVSRHAIDNIMNGVSWRSV